MTAAAAVGTSGAAMAQPATGGDWQVSAGPGVLVSPRYPGAAGHRVLPIPALELRRDRLFFNGQSGLGVDLVGDPRARLRLAGAVFVRFDREESDDPVRLRGLGDIEAAPQLRLIASHRLDGLGLGGLDAQAMLARDLGGSDGATLDLALRAPVALGRAARLTVGPTVRIGDARFNRAYFGVSPAQAAAGARRPYAIGGGVYQAGVGAALFWRLGGRWAATAIASAERLVGDAADSPVVAERTQLSGGAFLAYSF